MGDADTISILIVTDNHVGFMEKDPVRGQDSINTFQEILQIAQERDVDFILHGGDLFHENKPSRKTLHDVMALFREYCMGDKPCAVQILSDQSVNFPNRFATVNYQDPNLNVGIPVFAVHGNHDDPTGDGQLSALDLLSVSGFVNYYGKVSDVDDIVITPILLQKGTTKLALYGLGNVRDERLHRTFKRQKVKMLRPKEDRDNWFNLFTIHQNRVAHGATNYIPENFIDSFINFVLWGHEHDCISTPQKNEQQGFYVLQPGSSVATSLTAGEAIEKHIGILKINGTRFHWEKIKLKTVRPFIVDQVVLKEANLDSSDSKSVFRFLSNKVSSMIQECRESWTAANPDKEFPKPLVRLKVDYSDGFSKLIPHRFGQHFLDKVANPKEILQFHARKERVVRQQVDQIDMIEDQNIQLDAFKVEDLVNDYLAAQELEILPETELGHAVKSFVEKDDRDAIPEYFNSFYIRFVKLSLSKTRDFLKERQVADKVEEEGIKKEVGLAKKMLHEEFSQGTIRVGPRKSQAREKEEDDFGFEDDPVPVAPKKRAPAPRKTSTTAKTSNTKARKTAEEPKKVRGIDSYFSQATRPSTSKKLKEPSEDEEELVLSQVVQEDDDDVMVIDSDPEPTQQAPRRRSVAPPKGRRSAAVVSSDEENASVRKRNVSPVAAKPTTKRGRRLPPSFA